MLSRVIYLLLTVVITLSLATTGCGKAAEKASEKAAEKAIEDASGGKAKVDLSKGSVEVKTDEGTFKAGGANEWPKQLPADVPRFTGGRIFSVAENTGAQGKGIFIGIDSVAADYFDKYKSELEKSGWTIAQTVKQSSGFLITAKKETRIVSISFSSTGDKGFSGGVTYSEGKQ